MNCQQGTLLEMRLVPLLFSKGDLFCAVVHGIMSRLNSGNAWCHSVQNLLSSLLLSSSTKTKVYRTVILHVVLCGFETWSVTLREEHRL